VGEKEAFLNNLLSATTYPLLPRARGIPSTIGY